MDPRNDIREFLVSRRARITPEQAGLPAYGSNRRVKGLRREEVALLAGISAEYYVRLERGNLRGVSEDVLDGIARALQLDEAERMHLRDLARAANATPTRRGGRQPTQGPARNPANPRLVGRHACLREQRTPRRHRCEPAGRGVLRAAVRRPGPARQLRPVRVPQPARYGVLHRLGHHRQRCDRHPPPRSRPKPLRQAALGSRRGAVHPEPGVPRPVGRAQRQAPPHGAKRFHHPVVGELTLDFEMLDLPGDSGQKMLGPQGAQRGV